MFNARKRGDAAEETAKKYLQSSGLRLLDRNYRCRMGEIDLIMQDGDSLVFVEVRFRNKSNFGTAQASIDYHKQRKLILTAQHYLQTHRSDSACRFDVIAINGDKNRIEWIKNAFSVV